MSHRSFALAEGLTWICRKIKQSADNTALVYGTNRNIFKALKMLAVLLLLVGVYNVHGNKCGYDAVECPIIVQPNLQIPLARMDPFDCASVDTILFNPVPELPPPHLELVIRPPGCNIIFIYVFPFPNDSRNLSVSTVNNTIITYQTRQILCTANDFSGIPLILTSPAGGIGQLFGRECELIFGGNGQPGTPFLSQPIPFPT